MQKRELVTEEVRQTISVSAISGYFTSEIGRRMLQSGNVRREWAFNLRLTGQQALLLQGVIDCAFEENGATLTWRDINAYFDHPRVLGLAEMMNYPGVMMGDRATMEKIVVSQAHHKKIDGHAPGLSGKARNAYMSAGVYSDHECSTVEDAIAKLERGQYIMIREGTAARNLEALVPLVTPQEAERGMFCSGDRHPGDVLVFLPGQREIARVQAALEAAGVKVGKTPSQAAELVRAALA